MWKGKYHQKLTPHFYGEFLKIKANGNTGEPGNDNTGGSILDHTVNKNIAINTLPYIMMPLQPQG